MSITSQYKSLLRAVERYEVLLGDISENMFLQSPPDGGWSYSEVFSHIFHANLASLIAAERCILGTGTLNTRAATWRVQLVLFIGRFPPGKRKAPGSIASAASKISREEASNMIIKFRKKLDDIRYRITKAEKHQKVKHPIMGLLNAQQWFRFIEIHTWHHTRQLKRIRLMLEGVS